MILTDVYIASLNKTYDFRLDENASVESAVIDIVEILLSEGKDDKERTEIDNGYSLCSYEHKLILPNKKTLSECGIGNGSKLLLV